MRTKAVIEVLAKQPKEEAPKEEKCIKAYYKGSWWKVLEFGDMMVLQKDDIIMKEVMRSSILALKGVYER